MHSIPTLAWFGMKKNWKIYQEGQPLGSTPAPFYVKSTLYQQSYGCSLSVFGKTLVILKSI